MYRGRGPALDWRGSGRVPILFRAGDDEIWRSVAGYDHQYGAYAVSAPVILHILAGAHHQFVLRDRLIGRRMGIGPLDEDAGAG